MGSFLTYAQESYAYNRDIHIMFEIKQKDRLLVLEYVIENKSKDTILFDAPHLYDYSYPDRSNKSTLYIGAFYVYGPYAKNIGAPVILYILPPDSSCGYNFFYTQETNVKYEDFLKFKKITFRFKYIIFNKELRNDEIFCEENKKYLRLIKGHSAYKLGNAEGFAVLDRILSKYVKYLGFELSIPLLNKLE